MGMGMCGFFFLDAYIISVCCRLEYFHFAVNFVPLKGTTGFIQVFCLFNSCCSSEKQFPANFVGMKYFQHD